MVNRLLITSPPPRPDRLRCGGGGEELNHFSGRLMGWLPVLLIVAGVLAMLIGYGLIRGVKHRDYLAWRQGREPFDMLENFARENAASTGVGCVLIGLGAALAIGGVFLWFAR